MESPSSFVFYNMSFSMYSCSLFNDFLLDDQVRKQSAMSKRGQKTTSNEGSPKAKARQCLVARDQRSEELSSRSLGSLVNPGSTDERKEVETAAGNSVRSASRSEVGYSQVSRQENVPIAAGNSMREEQLQTHSDERKHSNSNSTRRRVATTSELRNMEYTNRQYMSKIFQQYTSRLLNGFNLIFLQRRLHMRQERSLSNSWNHRTNQKLYTQTTRWNSGKHVLQHLIVPRHVASLKEPFVE